MGVKSANPGLDPSCTQSVVMIMRCEPIGRAASGLFTPTCARRITSPPLPPPHSVGKNDDVEGLAATQTRTAADRVSPAM